MFWVLQPTILSLVMIQIKCHFSGFIVIFVMFCYCFSHLEVKMFLPNMIQFCSDHHVMPIIRQLQDTANLLRIGSLPTLEPYQGPWKREDWRSYLQDLAPILLPNNAINPAPPPFEVRHVFQFMF